MGPLGGNLEPLEVSASLWQFSGSNKDHVLRGERVDFRAQAKKGLLRFTDGHWAKQNIVIPPDPRGICSRTPTDTRIYGRSSPRRGTVGPPCPWMWNLQILRVDRHLALTDLGKLCLSDHRPAPPTIRFASEASKGRNGGSPR